jgi:hypothetical protein
MVVAPGTGMREQTGGKAQGQPVSASGGPTGNPAEEPRRNFSDLMQKAWQRYSNHLVQIVIVDCMSVKPASLKDAEFGAAR